MFELSGKRELDDGCVWDRRPESPRLEKQFDGIFDQEIIQPRTLAHDSAIACEQIDSCKDVRNVLVLFNETKAF